MSRRLEMRIGQPLSFATTPPHKSEVAKNVWTTDTCSERMISLSRRAAFRLSQPKTLEKGKTCTGHPNWPKKPASGGSQKVAIDARYRSGGNDRAIFSNERSAPPPKPRI